MSEEFKLSTGRKVKIKDLTVDQIDDLHDIPEWSTDESGKTVVKYSNKARTAWIRAGLIGGDFEDWKVDGLGPPDSVIKQLNHDEKEELQVLIRKAQEVNPKKPSN
jgi:hypothetical protein